MRAVSTAVLYAPVRPTPEGTTLAPFDPCVWSHARKVIPGSTVPLKLALGRKRTRVLESEASALPSSPFGAPNGVQLAPLLMENSHVPLVLSTPMTTMPSNAP